MPFAGNVLKRLELADPDQEPLLAGSTPFSTAARLTGGSALQSFKSSEADVTLIVKLGNSFIITRTLIAGLSQPLADVWVTLNS